MYSVLSRSQQPAASTSSPRPPRKSSFLSLRREKGKSVQANNIQPIPPPSSGTSSTHCMQPSYPDPFSRSKTNMVSRVFKGNSKHPRSLPSHNRPCKIPTPGDDSAYIFPTLESAEDFATPTTSLHSHVRVRSNTGPSGKSHPDDLLTVTHLPLSGSSSTQYTEAPPRPPIDYVASRDPFEHFSLVAAPAAGVDVMDALVDGMNGGEGGSLISSRARLGIPNHHPLYQPPLPTPPPGIVLGGGKPRRTKFKPMDNRVSDSSDAEDHPKNMSGVARKSRRRARPSSSRTVSDATITQIPPTSFPNVVDEKPSPVIPPHRFKHEICRAPSATSLPEKPAKTVVPSISDIIRTYAPKEAQVRTRPPTSRSTPLYTASHHLVDANEGDNPTFSTQTHELDSVSRSSMDSIADEVQQTLRNQTKMKPITSASPSSIPNRHSIISDNASIYSPRSDPGGPTPSLFSSMTSFHHPASPYESSLFSSPSQAVAQYLRSARLTALLKLTRSPHASADNPLTVSLSDLGDRTGHPILVFLGLGCVRHVMGLYDEMADCMGLRLITIDR